MRLEGLEAFVEVADQRSFRRAAQRLGLTQAAVSQRIQRLEQDTGLQLFVRTSHRVELTAQGHELLPTAREALDAVVHAERMARRLASGDRGLLRIGTTFGTEGPLQELLRALRARHPGLHTELQRLHTPAKLDAVRRGDLEIAFVNEPRPPAGVQIELLFNEPLVAVLSLRSAPARGELALAALADRPLLLPPREWNPGVAARLEAILDSAPTTASIVEYNDVQDALSLAATSDAWMMVRESTARESLPAGLTVRRIAERPTVATNIAWSSVRTNPLVEEAIALAREIAAKPNARR
jgi:DNA-binding transcriptional LysR family regulator